MDARWTIALKIFNDIMDGKDGTLDTIGTYPLPDTGYFVGGCGKPLVFPSAEDANLSGALRVIAEFVKSTPARYAGWWTDSDTGKVYVDGTTWHANYNDAEAVTRERGEIAFWDIGRAREIRPVGEGE